MGIPPRAMVSAATIAPPAVAARTAGITPVSSILAGAASALGRWEAGDNVPVICPSPFIEAQPPTWRPDYPLQAFLYSNLTLYPIAGRAYTFPFATFPFVTPPGVEEYRS